MKSTGIIRNVDELGRIVIPKEVRKNFKIEEGSLLEIYTSGNSIVLKKHQTKTCEICGTRVDDDDKFCRFCGTEL